MLRLQRQLVTSVRSGFRPLQPIARGLDEPLPKLSGFAPMPVGSFVSGAAVRSALAAKKFSSLGSLAFALADPGDPAQIKLFLKSLLGLADDSFCLRPGPSRRIGCGGVCSVSA